MDANSLHDLYLKQLKDLYDAEQQLTKALPRLAKAAASEHLRSAFEEHLEKTRGHAARLEKIFACIGDAAKAEKCKGMEGLISESGEIIDRNFAEDVKDAALIAAAQRIEHYEIAGYKTVRSYANRLGDKDAAALLDQTLKEEKEADEMLNRIAEQITMDPGASRPQNESARPAGESSGKQPAA